MNLINLSLAEVEHEIQFLKFADVKREPKYVVMSNDTYDCLYDEYKIIEVRFDNFGYTVKPTEFCGLKIAFHNNLKFGEVDIV